MNKKIIIFSGGTGGHVIPSINLGNFLIENGFNCILILDKRGEKYSDSFKGKKYIISSSHLSGNFFDKIRSIINLSIGFFQSLYILLKFQSKIYISFGSYATLMPLTVAIILKLFSKINIYIHEQNSVVGKVNYIFLPFAKNIFTNLQITKNIKKQYQKKIVHSGLPISINLLQNDKKNIKKMNKTYILIYGGSQGSIPLIEKSLEMLKTLRSELIVNIYVFVQAPKILHDRLNNILIELKLDYEIKEFYNNFDKILSLTDLAITRAGAGTINDLILNKIPAIIMPLPNSINQHQYYNAKFLSDINAGYLLKEDSSNITDIDILKELLEDKNKRIKIINELAKIDIPNANLIMLSNIK